MKNNQHIGEQLNQSISNLMISIIQFHLSFPLALYLFRIYHLSRVIRQNKFIFIRTQQISISIELSSHPMPSPNFLRAKSSYPDMSPRQNPQFKQTTTKYLNQKKQRKQLDLKKQITSNQLKHFQKVNHQLTKSLEQKQQELEWLKQVRQRYITEMHQKKQKQQQEKLKLDQLRMYNTTIRQKNIKSVYDALNQLHKQKSKAHDQVNQTMKQLKQNYRFKKSISDANNHNLFLEVQKSRLKGKQRINKFFQKQSTQLTKYYKSMTEFEQQAINSGVRQINQMHERQSIYKQKISKKQAKMSKVINQIQQLKKSSFQLASSQMRSSRYGNLSTVKNKSKLSRTQRTENISNQKNSIGFKFTNPGSTQFLTEEEIR